MGDSWFPRYVMAIVGVGCLVVEYDLPTLVLFGLVFIVLALLPGDSAI